MQQDNAIKVSTQKWWGSFFVRTFVSYLGVIGLVFILIFLFSQAPIRNFYLDKLKTHLKQVGFSFQAQVVELYESGQFEELDRKVKQLGEAIDIRITAIQPDGTVVADSEKPPSRMENHGTRPEILKAYKGEIADSIRFSTTVGEQMLYLAIPINSTTGETMLVLRLSLYLSEIKELISQLKWKFTTLLLVLLVVALGLSWYFSSTISTPVREIMTTMKNYTEGDFDARVFVRKKDELGEMAVSFNTMAARQKKLFDDLSSRRAELQAIISSMKEGLIVIERNGQISLCNESFSEIVGKKCGSDSPYWEMLRIPDFEDYVKHAFSNGKKSTYQKIMLKDKTYLVGFNRMKSDDRLVVIFRDITDFEQLETMKKDFVVNLTHELKTPLTAIKGFMETIEEEEDIKNQEYVDIIKRHTDRMTQIVSDLLVLSELEALGDNRRSIHFEPVDLGALVNNILKIYQEKVKERQLELDIDIPEELPPVMGEKFKLEQMLINLLDNAVKYTHKEKGRVGIILTVPEGDADSVTIRVENNGAPIPRQSLSRIFERFYVVDKSRSRKLGGTGLGLSIVKHVVKLHNGEISVDSHKDSTAFTIRLPLKQEA